jgi:hypothetical protein
LVVVSVEIVRIIFRFVYSPALTESRVGFAAEFLILLDVP